MKLTGWLLGGAAALGGAYFARLIGPQIRPGDDVPIHFASLQAQLPLVPANAFAVILHVTAVTPTGDLQGNVTGWSDATGSILDLPLAQGAAVSVQVPASAVVQNMKVQGTKLVAS